MEGRSFDLTFRGYDEPRARAALLRSAYIAAFALLGYRYILRSALDVVRDQIAKPDADLIPRFSLHLGGAEPRTHRLIISVTQPASLRCVLVGIGDQAVFLPGLEPWPRIYERLAA